MEQKSGVIISQWQARRFSVTLETYIYKPSIYLNLVSFNLKCSMQTFNSSYNTNIGAIILWSILLIALSDDMTVQTRTMAWQSDISCVPRVSANSVTMKTNFDELSMTYI